MSIVSGEPKEREHAFNIITLIDKKRTYPARILDRYSRKYNLQRGTIRFLTQVVYGSIKMRRNIDYVIETVSSRQMKNMERPLITLLRLGVYQLLYMDEIYKEITVDASVEIAKEKCGQPGGDFVNFVLRETLRSENKITYPDVEDNPVEHIALKYSFQDWMVRRWIDRFGVKETVRLCAKCNEEPPLTIRANTLLTDKEALIRDLRNEGVGVRECEMAEEGLIIDLREKSIWNLPAYDEGLFYVQDEASMLVPKILEPEPGDTVIDACSSPGGKATHIAEMMGNTGRIIAFDVTREKIDLLRENADRLGISILEERLLDVTREVSEYFYLGDKVLADLPCTGLGTLWRKADERWRRQERDVLGLQKLQLIMLDTVSNYVKTGGILVFSVCSFEPEENEIVVDRFLSKHKSFRLMEITKYLPEKALFSDGEMKLFPHTHNTDGMYAVRMVRT